jgi:hypothetical protein
VTPGRLNALEAIAKSAAFMLAAGEAHADSTDPKTRDQLDELVVDARRILEHQLDALALLDPYRGPNGRLRTPELSNLRQSRVGTGDSYLLEPAGGPRRTYAPVPVE